MVIFLHGVGMGLATYLLMLVALRVVNIKIIFKSKSIVIVLLAPAIDQGKCVSSKILSRFRRSCIWVEIGKRSPKTMETLPKREFLF
jgi:hypothetical protein